MITGTILSIVLAAAPFWVPLLVRLFAAKPKLTADEQHKENEQNIAKTIAIGDERAVNTTVDDFLRRLQKSDKVRGDSSGQGNKEG